ncbi:hypothetical protein Mmc1_1268 [Magnetococcus marinus MC-1]|uniref:Uncharacterized protein n=1 Tax=Magnetococcus marinus (strain ATCC BAA-1437 / JCM 17883 / MC-1) TaxID=156889 RepID=A0L736_MAGMM|nr:hypothetical protein [Magnetococcus marinus]ABK43779.1 hypothetical protein Mmc1_1268 [Magnetococcus marinus MC-1]
MQNYLQIEGLIVQRLKDQLEGIRVLSSWGMPVIHEEAELPPTVIIFLEEDKPGPIQGNQQKVEQTWLCLVVVRDAESDAGALISRVITAVVGWTPDRTLFKPFQRTASAYSPDYSPNGIFYFPLAFETSFLFKTTE